MRGPRLGLTVLVSLSAIGCAQEAPDAETATTAEPAPELLCSTGASHEDAAARPSPLDSVLIDIGGASAKLCYGRPSARERVMVGGIDPFDTPWRMGANEPTTLHLGFAATVGGIDLEPGSYAIFAIPTEGAWTIVVNGNPDRWGIPITDEVREADIGSFEVTPSELEEHVETLTFSFEASDGGGDLVFAFENRTFAIPIRAR